MQFIRIPPNAVIAHYVETEAGKFAVITSKGETLAASFYELRHLYEPLAAINGLGCWVIMLPKPQPEQLNLF